MTVTTLIAADGTPLPDKLVPRETAAEFLALSVATLATWASAGCGPTFIKLSSGKSGAVRYRLSELQRFADDPVGYRPRLIAPFRATEALKRGGNPKVNVSRARRRRGKGATNKP